jgi:hypothetical protein
MAPPTSPASHSRKSSNASARYQLHAPTTPSQLRNSHVPSERSSSPEDTMHTAHDDDEPAHASSSAAPQGLALSTDGGHMSADRTLVHSADEAVQEPAGGIIEVDLEHQEWDAEENGNHGASSPRPASGKSYGSFGTDNGFGARYPGPADPQAGEAPDVTDPLLGGRGQKSTTQFLAERHGVKNKKLM